MADIAKAFAECSWGTLRLFASQVHTDSGRTQVVHELSSGDRHPVQDRGLRVRRVRLRLQFDDFPGQLSPVEAIRALEAAKNTGKAAIFSHPFLGRFLASVGEFNSEVDESSVISAECEFIQEDDDIAVTPTGAASSGTSGESSVTAAATALDTELEATGQLKMSADAAVEIASRLPGGITPTDVRGKIDLTVVRVAALVNNITGAIKETSDSALSELAAIASAPLITEFGFESARVSAKTLLGTTLSVAPDVAALLKRAAAPFIGRRTTDPSVALSSVASSEAEVGNFAPVTMDARVAVSRWASGEVPTRQIMIDAARISNNIAVMIEVGGFETDLALFPAFRASIMLGEAVRNAAIAATSETPSVFVMRVLQPTALLPLAAQIYGGAAAQEKTRQIVALNDISTPGWLAPGDYVMPTRLV